MKDFLKSILYDFPIYKVYLLVTFAILYAWLSRRFKRLHPGVSFLLYFIVLFLCWKGNISDVELNTDESEWLARANDLLYDPVSWFHERMHYPLFRIATYIPLSVMGLWFKPLTWFHARIFAVILWSALVVLYKSVCRDLFSDRVACLSAIVMVWWIGLMTFFDYVSYNSELPVILLVLLAYRSMAQIILSEHASILQIIIAAVAVTMIPFAKEQALFISVFMGMSILWVLYKKMGTVGPLRFMLSVILLLFSLLVPIFLTGKAEGLFRQIEWFMSYGRHGFADSESGIVDRMRTLCMTVIEHEGREDLLSPFIIGLGSFMASTAFTLLGWIKPARRHILFFWHVVALLGVSLYCVFLPQTNFPHYRLLLVPALFLLVMFGTNLLTVIRSGMQGIAVLSLILILHIRCSSVQRHIGIFDDVVGTTGRCLYAGYIKSHASTGDRMIVWGWNHAYYVETGLLPASEFLSVAQLNPNLNMAEYATGRFVWAIDSIKPRFILELVGKDQFYTKNRNIYAISQFPEIQSRISAYYKLFRERGSERLYVRKEVYEGWRTSY